MAEARKDILVSWLNDAYAMEKSLINILEKRVKDGTPAEAQSRYRQHLEETRRHAQMVEGCVSRLGETTSTLKNMMGTLFGKQQGLGAGLFKDEQVKNALSDYASENLEIASYKALIVAAEDFGDPEIASVCRRILEEEERMAQWLADQSLPLTVKNVFRHAA
ncbi:MAG: ferritin-like domain-containing protein [Candidatus Tectomicrobia bacterium]|uniref:Ferritin-like domain-containing protein n=1 Tax=Tectimicrobiota bacterium TaxID=2528274 RepID=A0A932MM74_UNCTE|nr:ferritin-like domain-containing protein [Candidatus Tectomicrobia bacterium]